MEAIKNAAASTMETAKGYAGLDKTQDTTQSTSADTTTESSDMTTTTTAPKETDPFASDPTSASTGATTTHDETTTTEPKTVDAFASDSTSAATSEVAPTATPSAPTTTTTTTDTSSDTPAPTESLSSNKKDQDDSVPETSQKGKDPAVVGETGKTKMTGTGAPGSHSALFGLTPDGKKTTESDSKTTAPVPTTGDKDKEASGGGKESDDADVGSRGTSGGEAISEQVHDPRVAEKGHEGSAVESEGTGKPGSGA